MTAALNNMTMIQYNNNIRILNCRQAVSYTHLATVKELADYLHLSEDEIKEIMKISLDAISTDDTSISSQHSHHHHESE